MLPDDIDKTMTATPAPAKKSRSPRCKPRRTIDPSDACPTCGDYLNVRWRGRWWCICCDHDLLFGPGGDE